MHASRARSTAFARGRASSTPARHRLTAAARANMSEGTPQEKHDQLEKMCNTFQANFKVPEMTVAEVKDKMQRAPGEVVLVDCRNPEEQEVSMIPHALTKDDYSSRKPDFKGKAIVCYCTVGYRSCGEAKKLREIGIDAYNLRGSIIAWTQANEPLISGKDQGQATKSVHTYSPDWALQGDGYQPVSYGSPKFQMFKDVFRGSLKFW